MGLKGRRVHMIEELTETIISFQRWAFVIIVMSQEFIVNPKLFTRLIALAHCCTIFLCYMGCEIYNDICEIYDQI